MKSKLAMFVVLSGWFLFFFYIFYEFGAYGSDTLKYLFNLEYPAETLFHIIMFTIPVGSTITGYLINERKKIFDKTLQSEKRLEHAAREWRVTFDAMPYGVMLIDGEFNIMRANKYVADFAGMPIKELIFNKKCYEIIHKRNRPLDDCPLVKSASTRNTETLEYYDPSRHKYFIANVTPVFNDEGAIIAYSHPLIDITDIKQKEEKLIKSRDAFFNMLKDIDSAHKELKGVYQDLVVAFANIIDAKSPWTKGHSERVTDYAISIAKEMGVNGRSMETLKTAGLLHDIGKIGTYDIILDKPDRLTDAEFTLIRRHTIKGEEILRPIKGLEHIFPIIRSHHEKFDGTGYPDGLKGDEIPLLARILCVADSYDSMTSDRPYRPAPGEEYAIEELKRCSGTHFDPQVVEVFLRVLENKDNSGI